TALQYFAIFSTVSRSLRRRLWPASELFGVASAAVSLSVGAVLPFNSLAHLCEKFAEVTSLAPYKNPMGMRFFWPSNFNQLPSSPCEPLMLSQTQALMLLPSGVFSRAGAVNAFTVMSW